MQIQGEGAQCKAMKNIKFNKNAMSISEPWSQLAPTALCKALHVNSWHGFPKVFRPQRGGFAASTQLDTWSDLLLGFLWVQYFWYFLKYFQAWILDSYTNTCITGPRRSACAPSPVQSWVLRAPKRQAAIDCRGLTCTYGERGLKSAINDE